MVRSDIIQLIRAYYSSASKYIAADICDITKLQGSVFTFFVMDLALKTFIFIPQSADVMKSHINI